MQTIVETPSYLAAAKAAGITERMRSQIVTMIARDPTLSFGVPGVAESFGWPGGAKGKAAVIASSTSIPAPTFRCFC